MPVRSCVGGVRVTEKAFMQAVIDLAHLHQWLVYHPFNSRHSPAGFPDLIAIRGQRMLAIECKTDKGKVTLAQQAWPDALSKVPGIEAMVIRPGASAEPLVELLR